MVPQVLDVILVFLYIHDVADTLYRKVHDNLEIDFHNFKERKNENLLGRLLQHSHY